MDVAQHNALLANAPARSESRQHVIARLGSGLAALCVLAGAVTAFVLLRDNAADNRTIYAPDLVNGVLAYDVNDIAATSYGSLTETIVHVSNSEQTSEVDFSLRVDNSQLLPMRAPSLGQFRVINEAGEEATYLGGGWQDNDIVLPRWSTSADFRYLAPPTGGMLLLEYREHPSDAPINIAVGFTLQHPEASHHSS